MYFNIYDYCYENDILIDKSKFSVIDILLFKVETDLYYEDHNLLNSFFEHNCPEGRIVELFL